MTDLMPTICPKCGLYVSKTPDGVIWSHQRYADGYGYGPDQPHTLIECEAVGTSHA